MNKLLVIGLDCAAPNIMFDKLADQLPNISKMREDGVWGKLRSCDPPITVPAWMVMATGRTPGELGLYGFRSREGNSYNKIKIPTSRDVKYDTIWDIIGKRNKRSIVIAVPPSYPPRPITGILVTDFLTPGKDKEFTYPPGLKNDILAKYPDYEFDVKFRKPEKEKIIDEIYKMTETRFRMALDFMRNKPWDLFFFVEIGIDRIHHAFWRYIDENHHLYENNPLMREKFVNYFKMVDRYVGEMVEQVDEDTLVMIVSDHGAKGMKGAFAINEWLIKEGYLKLKSNSIKPGSSLDEVEVDWENTKAWAWGGYYARVFLNIKGRQEKGVIDPQDVRKEIEILKEKLKSIKGPNGETWDTKVFEPEEKYDVVNGDISDLFVYFDDLNWRAAGTLGYGTMYLLENDTGPDDAVHDYDGIYVLYRKGKKVGKIFNETIYNVMPTMLDVFSVRKITGLKGKVMEGMRYVK